MSHSLVYYNLVYVLGSIYMLLCHLGFDLIDTCREWGEHFQLVVMRRLLLVILLKVTFSFYLPKGILHQFYFKNQMKTSYNIPIFIRLYSCKIIVILNCHIKTYFVICLRSLDICC